MLLDFKGPVLVLLAPDLLFSVIMDDKKDVDVLVTISLLG